MARARGSHHVEVRFIHPDFVDEDVRELLGPCSPVGDILPSDFDFRRWQGGYEIGFQPTQPPDGDRPPPEVFVYGVDVVIARGIDRVFGKFGVDHIVGGKVSDCVSCEHCGAKEGYPAITRDAFFYLVEHEQACTDPDPVFPAVRLTRAAFMTFRRS